MTTFELVCLIIFSHGLHAIISAILHNCAHNTEETPYGVTGLAFCIASGSAFLTYVFT